MNDIIEPKIPYEPPAVVDIDPVTVNVAAGVSPDDDDWNDDD